MFFRLQRRSARRAGPSTCHAHESSHLSSSRGVHTVPWWNRPISQRLVAGSNCREASLTMAHAGPRLGARFGVADERTLRIQPFAKMIRPFGSLAPPAIGHIAAHPLIFGVRRKSRYRPAPSWRLLRPRPGNHCSSPSRVPAKESGTRWRVCRAVREG